MTDGMIVSTERPLHCRLSKKRPSGDVMTSEHDARMRLEGVRRQRELIKDNCYGLRAKNCLLFVSRDALTRRTL